MTVFIPLEHGVLKMDLEDRLRFPGRIYSYQGDRKINILTYSRGKTRHIHREILGVTRKDLLVDHKNGDRFNIRKTNLRICKVGTNNKNKADYTKTSDLPRGVTTRKNGKFAAAITLNKKAVYLGLYDTAEEAHQEFRKAHIKAHGKNSVYNVRSL